VCGKLGVEETDLAVEGGIGNYEEFADIEWEFDK
jgi:hypothetical protein